MGEELLHGKNKISNAYVLWLHIITSGRNPPQHTHTHTHTHTSNNVCKGFDCKIVISKLWKQLSGQLLWTSETSHVSFTEWNILQLLMADKEYHYQRHNKDLQDKSSVKKANYRTLYKMLSFLWKGGGKEEHSSLFIFT